MQRRAQVGKIREKKNIYRNDFDNHFKIQNGQINSQEALRIFSNKSNVGIKRGKAVGRKRLRLLLIIIEMRGRVSPLYQLAINSVNLYKNYTKNQPLAAQCEKYNITSTLSKLNFEGLGIRPNPSASGIGIRNILLHNSLRLTIYYLPQNKIMKLHDHPEMEVVNFVLKGKMQAKIYSHVEENVYRREMHTLQANSIKYIDGLYTKQDNLHEFKAIQPTYFLDIIFPDYDEQRPCNFYEEQNQGREESNNVVLKSVDYMENDFFQI